jgi:hypothetical protein
VYLSSVGIILSVKVEQRVYVKFLAKLGKNLLQKHSLLMKVYGDECLSHTQVFEWFKRSKEGRGEPEEQVKFQSNDDIRFDIRGIVHTDWVPEGQTINHVFYKEVLTLLREWVRRKRPEMWKKGSRILHHDNAPAHNALSVKTFLVKHRIPVLEHPPYSLDLAPCAFYYFKRSSLH